MKHLKYAVKLLVAVFLAVFIVTMSGVASQSGSVQSIGAPQCSPSSLCVKETTPVIVTVKIAADPQLITSSVNLVRVNQQGKIIETLARMYDDGTHGDAVPEDGIYTAMVTLDTSAPGRIDLAVTAAYKGKLLRSESPITAFSVLVKPTHQLTVDVFGQGNTVDNSAEINCGAGGNNCSAQFTEGQTVTLTPSPSKGWLLNHWAGCDSVNNGVCTVTMSSDKTVSPVFGTATTTVKPNVVVLDSTTMSLLRNQAGTTLIFDISATVIANLKVGDVIISQVGNGFAYKVKSVTVIQGSSIYVETDSATLEDIIEEGTLIFHQTLTTPVTQNSVRRSALTDSAGAGLTFDYPFNMITPININGDASATITPDLDLSIDTSGIKEFRFAIDASSNISLNFSSTDAITIPLERFPIATFTLDPICIFTPVPVVFVPKVQLNMYLNQETDGSSAVSMDRSDWAQCGIHYIRSVGFQPIDSHTSSFTAPPPTITKSLSLKYALNFTVGIYIYDILGPQVTVGPYVEAQVAQVEIQPPCYDSGVYYGLSANAGIGGQILSWSLPSYTTTLLDLRSIVFSQNLCPNTQPPSTPQNLTAVAVSPSEIDLSWDPSTSSAGVAGYRINRTDGVTAQAESTFYQDTNLQPFATYCYTVTAYDQAQNYSSPSVMACATTMPTQNTPSVPKNLRAVALSSSEVQLSWDASSDVAGIAGYTVYRDGIPVISTSDVLTADDIGLHLSTTYCYAVSAYDGQGNVSALTNPVCVTTKAAGSWSAEVACSGEAYQVFFNFDLDVSTNSTVQADGTGDDYDGTPLAFVLTGVYSQGSGILNGSITWSFTGSPCIRVDDFSASLGSGDSGNVIMDQVEACGCTAEIRFISSGTESAASIPKVESIPEVQKARKGSLFHSPACGR
jgi:chitodextrinase